LIYYTGSFKIKKMHEALLYQKLKNKSVRCLTCQKKCVVENNGWGFCQTRINKDGRLYSSIYGIVSSINLDPIEKKPVYRFRPGSMCLSLGTYGCNFRCQFCQNSEISYVDCSLLNLKNEKYLSPAQVVKMAIKLKADGIAFTYNEPAIWLEYSLDCCKEIRNLKLEIRNFDMYTCWVTNGYATTQAIDVIAPYLDIYRVDLKSPSDNFYQKLIGIPRAKGVFDTTKYVHDKYPKIHIECVTNIIPGWNDDEKDLKNIAAWIVKNLGSQTPWHVTRFFPHARMTDTPPTPIKTIMKAKEIGQKQGLAFVYGGNL